MVWKNELDSGSARCIQGKGVSVMSKLYKIPLVLSPQPEGGTR